MSHQVLKNIRAIRKQKLLSQEYMAEQLGATQSSYARFENHVRKIDFELVEQIAGIFNMSLGELVSWHTNDNNESALDLSNAGVENSDPQKEEIKLLKERIAHLEQVKKLKDQQISDKDMIINLLKSKIKDAKL